MGWGIVYHNLTLSFSQSVLRHTWCGGGGMHRIRDSSCNKISLGVSWLG